MPAIVRQPLRTSLAKDLLASVLGPESDYYIGIGKSDIFGSDDTVPAPIDSSAEEREFRNNLQSVKKVEGAVMVTRRYNWTNGNKYQGWDDNVSQTGSEFPFYVMNSAKEVYLCLSHGIDDTGTHQPSTVEPNYYTDAEQDVNLEPPEPMQWKPFILSDGYTWKYMFSLTPENIYTFLSSNHIPVQPLEDELSDGDSIEDLQWHVADKAIGGQIISIIVTDGGEGYDQNNPPVVKIEGDGTGATATAVVDTNGQVVRIDLAYRETVGDIPTRKTITSYGSGYSRALITIEGGNGEGEADAKARPVITTSTGLGADASSDFKTSSVLMTIKPNGDENNRFILENSFRQIGILRGPKKQDGTPYTGAGDKCLSSFTLNNNAPFDHGELVEASSPSGENNSLLSTGAVAYVNEVKDKTVYYHQNMTTGFTPFGPNHAVTQVSNSSKSGVIDFVTVTYGIDRYTGEVLYIENHPRIRRDAEQQEDIKVVITV
jgi:hypothetical protein